MTSSIDDKRSRSFGRMVGRINQRLIRDIAAREYLTEDLGSSQKMALILMKADGNRISELAKRMYVSKQAASKTVQELEVKGYVSRKKDPTDGRAAIIYYTPKAIKIVEDTLVYFSELESNLKGEFGEEGFEEICNHLAALAKFMDPDGF